MIELSDVLSIPATTCFSCGASRRGVVSPCPGCGKRPVSKADWRKALSSNPYRLNDQLQSVAEGDARYDNPVFRAVNQRSFEQSLADKQLQELLSFDGQSGIADDTPGRGSAGAPPLAAQAPVKRFDGLAENPFNLLRASATNTVAEIDAIVMDADRQVGEPVSASILLDSATRLDAEVRWLGGISFNEAQSLMSEASQSLPQDPLASVNLQCFRLVNAETHDVGALANAVGHISETWAQVAAEDVLRLFNADRRRAGVRSIADVSVVSQALVSRQNEIVAALVAVLESLPSDALLQCYESFSGVARTPGKVIEALVSHYRSFAEPVLLGEGDKVVALCRRGANQLRSKEPLAPDFVERLGRLMAFYHRLLRPLRSSPQGLGVVRTLSRMMRESFSELCEAAQQHADVEEAAALSSMQNTYFKRR